MLERRFANAGKGLAFTLAVPASIALAQILLAPEIVRINGLAANPIEARIYIANLRGSILGFHLWVGLLLVGYWLVTAALCRGDMLRARSANAGLLFSGFVFVAVMIVASLGAAGFVLSEPMCALLGVREPSEITYGFDPVSNCDIFSAKWLWLIFPVLPVVLLLVSAVLRIVVSRRRSTGVPG